VKYYVAVHDLSAEDEKALWDCQASFDGGTVEKGMFINKATDKLDGAAHGVEEIEVGDYDKLVKEAVLLVVRSNTFSDFRFPLCVFGVENMTVPCFAPLLKQSVRSIKKIMDDHNGKLRFLVCDSHQSHDRPLLEMENVDGIEFIPGK